ncbi:MAG: hypothetical protein R2747_21545 [Pyrinomonadaceae bacterium]
MMIYKHDDEVSLLVKAFEERTLEKTDWTHAAHLTVGLYYCLHHPFGVAKNLMSDGIYWLNDAHGTPNTETSGYHETLTVFWLRTIAGFLEGHPGETSLAKLANGLLDRCHDTRLPLEYYTREKLFSVEARLGFVGPDLKVLPILSNEFAFA